MEKPADALTVAALQMARLRLAMAANYVDLLSEMVFKNGNVFGKDRVAFQRLLSGEEGSRVLEIVWKESELVQQTDLAAAGYKGKSFREIATCHALGLLLAQNKHEVAATVTRVRNIVIAGSAYGLIRREKLRTKMVAIHGTPALHSFMVELGLKNCAIFRDVFPQMVWTREEIILQPTNFIEGTS